MTPTLVLLACFSAGGSAGLLSEDYGWSAGTIHEQLRDDPTLVPFGKGAIFVPAMTNPLDEPPVSVWQGGQKVAEGTTGRRILVLPGAYNVRMGSGTVEQRFSVQTTVRELHTSVVPVSSPVRGLIPEKVVVPSHRPTVSSPGKVMTKVPSARTTSLSGSVRSMIRSPSM